MPSLKIGLYKHKKTGEFDVMIDEINNSFKVHNGEFERVEQFNYEYFTKEEEKKRLTKNLELQKLHNLYSEILEKELTTSNKLIAMNCRESGKDILNQMIKMLSNN